VYAYSEAVRAHKNGDSSLISVAIDKLVEAERARPMDSDLAEIRAVLMAM